MSRELIENLLLQHLNLSLLDKDLDIIRDLNIDSMKILEIIIFVESTYEIEVVSEDLIPDNWASVNAIADFIQEKFNKDEL